MVTWSSENYQFIDVMVNNEFVEGSKIVNIEYDGILKEWKITLDDESYILIKGNVSVVMRLKLKNQGE